MLNRLPLFTVLAWSASIGPFSAPHQSHSPRPSADVPATAPFVRITHTDSGRVVEVDLTAAPARLPLVNGHGTDVYAYNGMVPGPTLEFREGDHVVIRLRNALPEQTTIHWHGLHLPFLADGSPFHPVAPGETFTYAYRIHPGTAGTYWYHPHPHHATGTQVARGLFGAVIVRADDDPLPADLTEQLIVISDNRFREDGAIDFPDRHSHDGRVDAENGREGDVLFVNGKVMPSISMRSGEVQRWRVVNASAARIYRLAIPGHTLLHVGTDGGLFEFPVATEEILLAPAERVELLVRASAPPGTRTALETRAYDRYIPQTRPKNWNETRELLAVQYTNEVPLPVRSLPAQLRHVPPLDTLAATATHVMVLTQHLINGRAMDMDRIDVRARLGATEIWQVENLVGMDHPFHLHGFQFQVIERNGVPEPYRAWKDVVNVPRHESARFIVRYDNYAGKWMFHCHILDHEDHGMMGILEVEP